MKKYIWISLAVYIVMWILTKVWTAQPGWQESEYLGMMALLSLLTIVNSFVAFICSLKYIEIFLDKQLAKIKK